jgi:phosphotransferase system  glucose/maltose/N-acetylglucosamine-specific IIC component
MALPKDRWPGARYGILFPVAVGLYTPLCAVVAWNANNLAGSWKRAIGMALQITIGNLGGAVGSNIYLKREAPNYWTGYTVSLVILVAAIVSGILLRVFLRRINVKREGLTEGEVRSMHSQQELDEMGDTSPLFRYTL